MSETNTLNVIDKGRQKIETKPSINIKQALEKLMDYITERSDIFIPIIVISALVIFVVYQIYTTINDKNPMKNLTTHIYLTVIPIIFIFAYIIYIVFDNKSKHMFYQISIFALIIFFIVYSIIALNTYKLNFTLQNVFSYSFIAIIGLFGLSLFYNIFANQLRTTDTWGSFWIEFIFYIPCIIEKFIKQLMQEYTSTSGITITMFIIEILLIIFYFYFYPMYKDSIYKNGVIALNTPVYLNHTVNRLIQPIKNVDADRMQPPDDANNPINLLFKPNASTFPYRRNYSISFWIYINPMPLTRIGYAEETNIFFYGKDDSKIEYHPKISLTQQNNNHLFNVYYSGSKPTHTLDLPLQKWNNIVFNYLSTSVDVFVNGELTLSHNFSEDLPIYDDDDDISVGDTANHMNTNVILKNDGIYGSICNIVYYKIPLTKREIVRNYNMLSVNNPPIFT